MNPSPSTEATSSPKSVIGALGNIRPVYAALTLLLLTAIFRLWYVTRMELVPDEAYYWLWSKHLALSYRDKGPIVAWAIALGNWLFGDSVFGIRVCAVLFSAGTGWLLFQFARRIQDSKTALWTLVLASVVPMIAVGSLLMTIDAPSLFFWVWAMNVFWTAIESKKLWHWFGLGVLIGLGFLSKFTNGLQLMCIAMFLVWSKPHRSLLFSRQTVILIVGFSLTILPLIWWNMQTGWVHYLALHSRSGVDSAFHIRPMQLLKFIGGVVGVVSPFIGFGMIAAIAGMLWKRHDDLRIRFLLSQVLPVFGVFCFFSLNKSGKENWPAPALLAGMILTVAFWRELTARVPRWRWPVKIALGFGALMTIVIHNTDYLHLPYKLEPLKRAQGWHDYAAHIQKARVESGATLLIGSDYSEASMMAYYLPDQPTTYLPKGPYGENQFTLWPTYSTNDHTRALYVTDRTKPPPSSVLRDFPRYKQVDDFWALHKGRPMDHFIIYLCERD